MHTPAPAFARTSGPKDAKIVLVGEAFGEQEDMAKVPFIGASGQELSRMLSEAGLDRKELLLTNTLAFRPENNNLATLCSKKAEVGKDYTLPPLGTGEYLRPEFFGELDRLATELTAYPRNLVVALGSLASWALLKHPKIGSVRGTVAESTLCPGLKVLPTFHPTYVLRMWSSRTVVVADLMKAKREGAFPEIKRPERFVLIAPTLAELRTWVRETLASGCTLLAPDIETGSGQIKCIGFARSVSEAIVVPFVDESKPGFSYWPDQTSEMEAWSLCEALLSSHIAKLFQNGIFDLSYLLKEGLKIRNAREDSMLLHHALFPEMLKGLGFLGSIYSSEPAWKLMRLKGQEELKRDE